MPEKQQSVRVKVAVDGPISEFTVEVFADGTTAIFGLGAFFDNVQDWFALRDAVDATIDFVQEGFDHYKVEN